MATPEQKALRKIEACYENQATELDLSGLQLIKLPAEIGQLQSLSMLYLRNNQLSELPAAIGELKNLSTLDLSYNRLSELPATIGQLQNLSTLDIASNQLRGLPATIGQLQNLSILYLSSNRLNELPKTIGQLQNLYTLTLDSNQLRELPATIGQLQNLSKLDLDSNQLRELPATIGQLQNLFMLYLSSNRLNELPETIGQLQNLSKLSLSSNRLSELPAVILNLELVITCKEFHELKDGEMTVIDNPLRDPPLEIIQQGDAAITAYFAAKDKKPLNELKVLLVGDGNAGKTSLLRRLIGEQFNPQESQTHGINIKPISLTADKREVLLNYWDFGGQEIMHHTHQFFLSKRSLYILVLDGRKEEKPEYWLDYILTLGGNSPVLVVLNKADQNSSFEVNRAGLQRKYPNIFGFYRISCKTSEGINALDTALQQAIFKVEMLQTMWPRNWFAIKQALLNLKKPFINEDTYVALCEQYQVNDDKAQDTLVEFLHQLGTVVHFEDLELREVHVLEPHWVTEAVYRIINHPSLAANKGILTLKKLPILLKGKADNYQYPRNVHRYIVALMKQFELCYSLNEKKLLIPDLLPVEECSLPKQHDALYFIVTYQFMPRSVLPRFIVKRHKDIKDQQQWRTGVVLYDTNTQTTALVRGDREQKNIEIIVTGERKREYLAIIRDTLSQIHSAFEVDKLGIDERIPLPDHPEHTVSYQELLGLERMGVKDIPIGKLGKSFAVQELLNGIRPPNARGQLYKQLTKLEPSQLEEVLFMFDMPTEYIRREVAPAQQIQDLIRYAQQQEKGLMQLQTLIEKVKG